MCFSPARRLVLDSVLHCHYSDFWIWNTENKHHISGRVCTVMAVSVVTVPWNPLPKQYARHTITKGSFATSLPLTTITALDLMEEIQVREMQAGSHRCVSGTKGSPKPGRHRQLLLILGIWNWKPQERQKQMGKGELLLDRTGSPLPSFNRHREQPRQKEGSRRPGWHQMFASQLQTKKAQGKKAKNFSCLACGIFTWTQAI